MTAHQLVQPLLVLKGILQALRERIFYSQLEMIGQMPAEILEELVATSAGFHLIERDVGNLANRLSTQGEQELSPSCMEVLRDFWNLAWGLAAHRGSLLTLMRREIDFHMEGLVKAILGDILPSKLILPESPFLSMELAPITHRTDPPEDDLLALISSSMAD